MWQAVQSALGNPEKPSQSEEEGENQTRTTDSAVQEEHKNNKKMAPKPAVYESNKVIDSEQSLYASAAAAAASDSNVKGTHHPHHHDHDDMSSIGHSEYTNSDGEESDASSVASKSRRSRRSRRSYSRSRRKHRSHSTSRRSSSRDVDDDDESIFTETEDEGTRAEEEAAQDRGGDNDATQRSSVITKPELPRVSVNSGHQRTVKLLNFQTLYRAEQDRCPLFTEELEKVTNHWSTCKQLIQSLVDEVKHANHLFTVSDLSFHQYSHVMYTIHKDIFLDDHGNRVMSSARQQLLLKQRHSPDGNEESSSSRSLSTSNTKGEAGGYLDPLYNSFSVLSDTMMKVVLEREMDSSKMAAALEFHEFSEELLTQAEAMKALGDSVVQEMEGSEIDIQNSFGVLEQLAAKIKNKSTVLEEDIKVPKLNKKFPKEIQYGGVNATVGDWWLWETLYRAAVKHQETSWSINQERLKGVEASLKFFQEKHQNKLEKAVLAVMPEQRQMFLAGASAFEAALEKTTGSNDIEKDAMVDHERVANEFDEGVQQHSSELMKKKTQHKSNILNRSRSKYQSGLAEDGMSASNNDVHSKALPAFGSPVTSKLVHHAKVLERWEKSGWMTTIAVFTVDRFLHLFDCTDLDTKTLPQTAFTSMFPTTASARSSVHHQGAGRKGAKRVTEFKLPAPSLTFNLVTCTLKTYGYSRRSFELKEVAETGLGFRSKDVPHTTLRFKDYNEAAEWYRMLQDLPEPDMGDSTYEQSAQQEEVKVEAIERSQWESSRSDFPSEGIEGGTKKDEEVKDGTADDAKPTEDKSESGNFDDFEDASEYFPSDDEGDADDLFEDAESILTDIAIN